MDTNIDLIKPHLVEHEGFTYVEYNGEFFKGCKRCGGTGHFSFNGYDSICYLCNNVTESKLGDHFATEADAQKWCHGKAVRQAQADRKREAKRLAILAVRQQRWDELASAHPEVWELVSKAAGVDTYLIDGTTDKSTERDTFVLSLADKLWQFEKFSYTERQVAALQRVVDTRKTRQAEAAATPAPAGRVVVTGVIASGKVVESDFGVAHKVLVKDDAGHKVWCTLPKALADIAIDEFTEAHPESYTWGPSCWFLGADGRDDMKGVIGRRLTFTATLSPSADDVAFAFGSRPGKASWL